MASSSKDIWAKLIAINPDKEDIPFASQPEEAPEFKPNTGWRIYQKSNEETWITNHSASSIRINDHWLEVEQEKEIFNGEKISFNKNKAYQDQNFDYVICLFSQKPKHQLKRLREENPESIPFLSNSETKKLARMNTDLQQEATCSICFQIYQKCATLAPCLHTFCSSCLVSCFKSSIQCPLCRKEATSVTKNTVLEKVVEIISKNSPDEKRPEGSQLEGVILKSPEVGTYVGDCQNGTIKEGKGIFIYTNGDFFDGAWKNDKREGPGIFELKNGDKYEGLFKDDAYNGLGKYIWAEGDEYEGNFTDGKREGFGTFRHANGNLYTGNWKNDEEEGDGVFLSNEGNKYEGSWAKGYFHGKGKFTWSDGLEYDGDWVENAREGDGTMKYSDGSIYEGRWADDEREGAGTLIVCTGDKYKGVWIDDFLEFVERIEYANGDIYGGEVQIPGFKKHGKGVMKYKNGDKYEGEWKNDKQHGKGKETSGNGKRIFEGVWKEGTMVGEVIMTDERGKKYKAEWKEIRDDKQEERRGERKEERKEQDKSRNTEFEEVKRLLALHGFNCISKK